MLRRAQPHLQHQQQRQAREETNAAAPRSLEALLAENTAVSAAGAGADLDGTASGGGGGRRFSVSSDWSPPPSTTKDALSRYGGSSSSSVSPPQTDVDGRGRVAVGVDAGAGSPKEGVRGAGTAEMATVATEAEAGASASVLMSAWGCSSNPPTPARMGFEDEAPWTPEGREPAVAGAGDKCDNDYCLMSLRKELEEMRCERNSHGRVFMHAICLDVCGTESDTYIPAESLFGVQDEREPGPEKHDLLRPVCARSMWTTNCGTLHLCNPPLPPPALPDRESSLGSPELSFRSPLKSDATAFLAETAMSCGKHPDASTPRYALELPCGVLGAVCVCVCVCVCVYRSSCSSSSGTPTAL